MNTIGRILQRIAKHLASRKVRVAWAMILGTIAAECGLDDPTNEILAILSAGVALIAGIAHEDNGKKAAEAKTAELGKLEMIDQMLKKAEQERATAALENG